ncbi:glutaredoxin family protein [Arthrobacter alpinus]|uniref:glutaredoxin family protein n=1 Tax=Arthrobacter alpinus TaxID=656366 RepID=UPI000A8993D2|nr:glutaredoxin family protein [Arthrobacter alpinus]
MDSTETTPAALPVPLLELVTKDGCHLCEDAVAVVSDVASELGLSWHEIRIDGDAELTDRYGEEVPVVLVDGVQRDFWQIDPVRLRGILARAMGKA